MKKYSVILSALILFGLSACTPVPEEATSNALPKIPESDAMIYVIMDDPSNYCAKFPNPGCFVNEITKQQGEFIEVSVRYGDGGGALAMLKKKNDGYVFIQMYQEPPNCALMEHFSVPESFYLYCYDSEGDLM